jgi:transcription antitermination protein NusB
MLNRREIRFKVLQSVYGFLLSENDRLDIGEKQMLGVVDRIYDLFIYQLALLEELHEFALRRMADGKNKFRPSEEDLHPNDKFVRNAFLIQLKDSIHFQHLKNQRRISWTGEEELVHKLYTRMRASEAYIAYMSNSSQSFSDDKQLLADLLPDMFLGFDALQGFYEELSVHWIDDYFLVLGLLERFILGAKKANGQDFPVPGLFKHINRNEQDDDRQFLIELFRKTIINQKEYGEMIAAQVVNWEVDRVALMDMSIMKMAIAEVLNFPSIPVKVSLNEYIELSKNFSTPKSKMFINGLLDKIVDKLRKSGRIQKVGRGLIDE